MDDDVRDFVRNRAAGRCEYCHITERYFTQLFQIEHIIPRCHGGADDEQNLALAYWRCNLCKGPNLTGIDPDTHAITRLFNPRSDVWEEHFALTDTGQMAGLTDVGRTTVRVLCMNEPRRVELRRAIALLERVNDADL